MCCSPTVRSQFVSSPATLFLREGDRADRFFLIETGRSSIGNPGKDHGEPVVVDTIGAGDLLGWSWMFPPYAWHFTARAVASTRAICFAGSVLREYCERDHSLGYELLKRMSAVMTRRMQNARRKMLGVHSGKSFVRAGGAGITIYGIRNLRHQATTTKGSFMGLTRNALRSG